MIFIINLKKQDGVWWGTNPGCGCCGGDYKLDEQWVGDPKEHLKSHIQELEQQLIVANQALEELE